MTTNFTNVFGGDTVPPSAYGYSFVTLTANTSFNWPETGTENLVSDIMDVSAASVGLSMLLPPANDVSVGKDQLIRNVGMNIFTVKDNDGTVVASVDPGAVVYLYLTSNTTPAGVWARVDFGVGTSSVDAATLVGYGIKAIGNTLNQSHPVLNTASGVTIDSTHRAKLVNYTGGVGTIAFTAASTLANDFFTLLRNSGTGTLTLNPSGSELIDGMATIQLQPGESLLAFCTGTAWYSVGYGRSNIYNFTQLVKDVSAGGSFTLTATEASNELLTFIGNPSANVTVIVPSVVAVYYILNSLSTAQSVTIKTAIGTGVSAPQGQRIIAICDATNIHSAQSVQASTTVSLLDGSVSVPALNFASQTNTGLYKYSVSGMGIAVAGVDLANFEPTGSTFNGTSPIVSAKAGPSVAQQHTIPAVSSDIFTLNAATQTLTNKTLTSPVIGGTPSITGPTIISVNTATAALRVTQIGAGNVALFEDSANPDATPVLIDASGTLVVGHASASPGGPYRLQSVGVDGANILSQRYNNTAGGAFIRMDKSRAVAIGDQSIVQANDTLGTLELRGSDGAAFQNAASIAALVDGTPAAGSMPGRLSFSTTPTGSVTPAERMRISNDGSVGIGTTSLTDRAFGVGKSITGASSAYGVLVGGEVQTDVTGTAIGVSNHMVTAPSAVMTDYKHFRATQVTIGAGSTIQNQSGFHVESTLTGAVNNYGFYGNIASGTDRYNFYAAGTAANQFNGETWIGRTTAGNGPTLNIGPDYTGSYGPTTVPRLKINSISNGATVGLGRWSADSTGPIYAGFKSRGVTVGAEGALLVNDSICTLTAAGSDGVAASGVRGHLTFRAAENWAAGAHGTFAQLAVTATGTTAMTTVMEWFGAGNSRANGDLNVVGVPTTSQVPNGFSVTATLTIAALRSGIITSTPAAGINLTLPTGTLTDAAFDTLQNNQSFEWSIINLAAATHAVTVLAGATHTVVGNMVVAATTSGRFLTRKTAANTFVTYRIA